MWHPNPRVDRDISLLMVDIIGEDNPYRVSGMTYEATTRDEVLAAIRDKYGPATAAQVFLPVH